MTCCNLEPAVVWKGLCLNDPTGNSCFHVDVSGMTSRMQTRRCLPGPGFWPDREPKLESNAHQAMVTYNSKEWLTAFQDTLGFRFIKACEPQQHVQSGHPPDLQPRASPTQAHIHLLRAVASDFVCLLVANQTCMHHMRTYSAWWHTTAKTGCKARTCEGTCT